MTRRDQLLWALTTLAVLLIVGTWFDSGPVYRLGEPQQAVVTQFGRPVGGPITDAGLHAKAPFIQTVYYFDKRFLEYEAEPTEVPTRDKLYVSVGAFARWRISDALTFFQRVQNEAGAQARLQDILAGEIRNAVARYDLIDLVRSTNRRPEDVAVTSPEESVILQPLATGRVALERVVLDRAAARASDLGIQVLDVRFKRLSYIPEVQKAVFARMIAERQRMAQQFISQGQGEAARIGGERERDLARIQSEAYRTAEQQRGAADADATRIYAEANGRDAEFYAFTKSLETYERSLDPNTMMILDSDSELLKYLGRVR
jgi:modulator of FtsH protease HflC